jgi:hypothetical protein
MASPERIKRAIENKNRQSDERRLGGSREEVTGAGVSCVGQTVSIKCPFVFLRLEVFR